jgi:Tol biopolymer transport system component
MGEVYRARDMRLGREVAIKVLPAALTGNPDRLARLEREARVLAPLNHPHIGMLYGLEESDGHRALILELVEGETLAERLKRGAVPLKQALGWARQIADALDAAHEKGVVHRDLKPANIKITPLDVVKVLDFGLARTYAPAAEGVSSPTITAETDLILGTAAYMSPEQAAGQTVDKRADVWAFGCVLYELVTGQMAFAGPTVPDTLSAVLNREPDWSALPADVPPAVVTLLRRCLEKDVRQRRRDIGDVRADLDDALARPAAVPDSRDRAALRVRRSVRVMLATAGVVATGTIGALLYRSMVAAPLAVPSEASVKRITDAVGVEEMPAVSPDGRDIAFLARVDGRRQIWIRRRAGGPALQITRDDVDHEAPRWTPDSSAIVYFTPSRTEGKAGTLWEIPALGGTPRRLVASLTGADVSHDGRRLATFQGTAEGIVLAILARDDVSPAHTIPIETAKEFGETPNEFGSPRWSPDDHSIAFYVDRGGFTNDLFVIDVATKATHLLKRTSTIKGLAWLPDGNGIVFASSEGSTMLYPPILNLRSVSRDGARERQLTFGDVSYEQPDIIRAGELFAVRVFMKSDIWRFPVSGAPAENVSNGYQITRQTGYVQTPSVSHDGKEIAYLSDNGGHSNVWVARVDGAESPRPLTAEHDAAVGIGIPIWSPVDNRIVFIRSELNASQGLTEWIMNSDGSDRRPLVQRAASAAWSSDGQWLYYQVEEGPSGSSCIYKLRVSSNAPPERVRCSAAVPAPAPDGTLYFVPRNFRHANEIYKAKPESDEHAVLVARYPASRVPSWPTGLALSPDGRWIAAPLKDDGTTNIWAIPTDGGVSRQLTDFGRRPTLIARQVSWSRDGEFVYAALAESDADIVLLEGIGQTSR